MFGLFVRFAGNQGVHTIRKHVTPTIQHATRANLPINCFNQFSSNTQLKINHQIQAISFWDRMIENAQKNKKQQQLDLYSSQTFYQNIEGAQSNIQMIQYNANLPIEDAAISQILTKLGKDVIFISIFDGHGGPQLAEYCSKHIKQIVEKLIFDFQNQPDFERNSQKYIKLALAQAYQTIQDQFYNDIFLPQLDIGNKKIQNVGACGLTALIYGQNIYVANAGDSQAIIVQQKDNGKTEYIKCNRRLSVMNPKQKQRLKKQFPDDQRIIVQERKNVAYLKGRLQPTKTLGDFYLKKQKHYRLKDKNGEVNFKGPYLTCTPQINVFKIDPSFQFLVLASDGIWDVLSKQEVKNSISNILQDKTEAQSQGHEIIDFNEQQIKQCQQKFQKKKKQCKQNSFQIAQMLLNNCLQKTAMNFKKNISQIKEIQAPRRRNYHDDITIAVVDLRKSYQ